MWEDTLTVNLNVSLTGSTCGHQGISAGVIFHGIVNDQNVLIPVALDSVARADSDRDLHAILKPKSQKPGKHFQKVWGLESKNVFLPPINSASWLH